MSSYQYANPFVEDPQFLNLEHEFLRRLNEARLIMVSEPYPAFFTPPGHKTILIDPSEVAICVRGIVQQVITDLDLNNLLKHLTEILVTTNLDSNATLSVLKTTNPSREQVGRCILSTFEQIHVLEEAKGKILQAQIKAKQIVAYLKTLNRSLLTSTQSKRLHLNGVGNTAAERAEFFSDSMSHSTWIEEKFSTFVKEAQSVLEHAQSKIDTLLRAESSLRMYLNFLSQDTSVERAQSVDFGAVPSYARNDFTSKDSNAILDACEARPISQEVSLGD